MTGTPVDSANVVSIAYVGMANSGGGVNVGKRVGGTSTMNFAAKVGSIVGVTLSVGVGGGSTMGKSAEERLTSGA